MLRTHAMMDAVEPGPIAEALKRPTFQQPVEITTSDIDPMMDQVWARDVSARFNCGAIVPLSGAGAKLMILSTHVGAPARQANALPVLLKRHSPVLDVER